MLSVVVRNLLFTMVVPGAGAVWLPWWILTRFDPTAGPAAWPAVAVVALGAALYLWCVWVFAVGGRGTPGPWDAPRRVVATGPYRWVRNPIYLAALLVVLGEAWLFLSLPLLVYAASMAIMLPASPTAAGMIALIGAPAKVIGCTGPRTWLTSVCIRR
jgi:protein-S-isoprenylcysteine O-methyltransferase Ste14